MFDIADLTSARLDATGQAVLYKTRHTATPGLVSTATVRKQYPWLVPALLYAKDRPQQLDHSQLKQLVAQLGTAENERAWFLKQPLPWSKWDGLANGEDMFTEQPILLLSCVNAPAWMMAFTYTTPAIAEAHYPGFLALWHVCQSYNFPLVGNALFMRAVFAAQDAGVPFSPTMPGLDTLVSTLLMYKVLDTVPDIESVFPQLVRLLVPAAQEQQATPPVSLPTSLFAAE